MTPSGPESAVRNTTDCKSEFVKKNRRENSNKGNRDTDGP